MPSYDNILAAIAGAFAGAILFAPSPPAHDKNEKCLHLATVVVNEYPTIDHVFVYSKCMERLK